MKKYLSIKDYALRCGVTTQQVYWRINKGLIEVDEKAKELYGGKVINIIIYPPIRKQKAGRPLLSASI